MPAKPRVRSHGNWWQARCAVKVGDGAKRMHPVNGCVGVGVFGRAGQGGDLSCTILSSFSRICRTAVLSRILNADPLLATPPTAPAAAAAPTSALRTGGRGSLLQRSAPTPPPIPIPRTPPIPTPPARPEPGAIRGEKDALALETEPPGWELESDRGRLIPSSSPASSSPASSPYTSCTGPGGVASSTPQHHALQVLKTPER